MTHFYVLRSFLHTRAFREKKETHMRYRIDEATVQNWGPHGKSAPSKFELGLDLLLIGDESLNNHATGFGRVPTERTLCD